MTVIGPKDRSNFVPGLDVGTVKGTGNQSETGPAGPLKISPTHVPQTKSSNPLAFDLALNRGVAMAPSAGVAAAADSMMDTRWAELDLGAQQLLLRLGGGTNDQQLGDLFDILAGEQWLPDDTDIG